jgi:signal peptidase I
MFTRSVTLKRTAAAPIVLSATIGFLLFLSGCNNSIHTYRVVGGSMLPLLAPGDRIFVDESNNARSSVHDGDVVLLRHGDFVFVKRILAMPGETISSDHRKVFRDGKQLDEPYLAPAKGDGIPALTTFPPRTMSPGEIFVMGDNRDNSADSRLAKWGPVRLSDIEGKYTWTYWHRKAAAK